jgi:hypothetical protein
MRETDMQYRRALYAVVVLTALAAGVALAQTAVAYSSISVTGTATAMTTSTAYKTATCSLETAQIRWTMDGVTTPTASVGHIADPGDVIQLVGNANLRQFLAIRTSGTSATLNCTFAQ